MQLIAIVTQMIYYMICQLLKVLDPDSSITNLNSFQLQLSIKKKRIKIQFNVIKEKNCQINLPLTKACIEP